MRQKNYSDQLRPFQDGKFKGKKTKEQLAEAKSSVNSETKTVRTLVISEKAKGSIEPGSGNMEISSRATAKTTLQKRQAIIQIVLLIHTVREALRSAIQLRSPKAL